MRQEVGEMAPVKQLKFSFSPESIVELRERLGLSQAEFSKSLGVPPNTLSRWEIGTTTPDAKSLAAIHSIAMERGISPSFFRKRKLNSKQAHLFVVSDLRSIPVQYQYLVEFDAWVRGECERRFSETSRRTFKAYDRTSDWTRSHWGKAQKLDELDWEVQESNEDQTKDVIHYCKSRCGQDPSRTTLILIARDGDYADLLEDLKDWGVRVYLIGVGFSQDLTVVVGKKRLIELPWPDNSPRISLDPTYHPWLANRISGIW